MISFESSVEIARAVPDVFAYVADPAAHEPRWHTDVVRVRTEPEGPVALGSVLHATFRVLGRAAAGDADVVGFEPDRVIRYAFRAPTFGLRPTLTYAFAPAPTGTRFTRRVDGEPFGLMRLVGPLMRPALARRNASFTKHLQRRLEASR